MRRFLFSTLVVAALGGAATAADVPAIEAALTTLKKVGREGDGNADAAKAWKDVTRAGLPALVPTLTAFDDATPAAANWLRSAVDALTDEIESVGQVLPKDDLRKFVYDTKRSPAARRIAFELVTKLDANAAASMLTDFVNDPSLELRRDAIAAEMKALAPKALAETQRLGYGKLFDSARDVDQVEELAKRLKDVGVERNVTKHFGFITEWHLSGVSDNTSGVGFAKAYEPETAGRGSDWKYAQSWDKFGSVDLNLAVGKTKNAVVYAAATILAEADTPAEIRLASQNAVKAFVNGKEVLGREEYHHGTSFDQHHAPIRLTKGRNEILVKVCQNDMTQDWAQVWAFAARVCDATGGALPLKQAITKDGKEVTLELGELAPAPAKKKEEKK